MKIKNMNIGTGAGFPQMMIAIFNSDKRNNSSWFNQEENNFLRTCKKWIKLRKCYSCK